MPEEEKTSKLMPGPIPGPVRPDWPPYDANKEMAAELMDVASRLMNVASKLLNTPVYVGTEPPIMPMAGEKE